MLTETIRQISCLLILPLSCPSHFVCPTLPPEPANLLQLPSLMSHSSDTFCCGDISISVTGRALALSAAFPQHKLNLPLSSLALFPMHSHSHMISSQYFAWTLKPEVQPVSHFLPDQRNGVHLMCLQLFLGIRLQMLNYQ